MDDLKIHKLLLALRSLSEKYAAWPYCEQEVREVVELYREYDKELRLNTHSKDQP
jgi:hypothetical protein